MSLWSTIRSWIDRAREAHAGHVYLVPDGEPVEPRADQPEGVRYRPADSGHRERRSIVLRQVGVNEVVPENSESWQRFGNVLEGENLNVRVVSASHQVIDTSDIRTVCSVCGLSEDSEQRSDISQRTLCRTCARPFTLPHGRVITVSPDEYEELSKAYDTWAEFDTRRERTRR